MSTEREPIELGEPEAETYIVTHKTNSPLLNTRRGAFKTNSPVEKILEKIEDQMQVLNIVNGVDLNDLVYPESLFLCYLCIRSG